MTEAARYYLTSPIYRQNAIAAVKKAADGLVVTIAPEKREDKYNRKLWAMLRDIEQQVEWYGQMLNSESWKALLTAGLTKEVPIRGIDGNSLVVVGLSTRNMSKAFFLQLIEFIYYFGAQHGVVWSDGAIGVISEYLEVG